MQIKHMMYVALFAAVVAVMGVIPPIPLPFTPVPITLQTLGIMLAGGVLGARLGSLSIIVFLILVAIGAAPLPGGRTGLSVFFGTSVGYILSWPIAAFVIGYLVERSWKQLKFYKVFIYNVIGGMIVVYLIGSPFTALIGDFTLIQAYSFNVAYIIGDTVKAIVAAFIAVKMYQLKPLIEPNRMAKDHSHLSS